MEELINRVAKSPLISIDLEDWLKDVSIEPLDLTDILENGFLLREMPFRTWVKELNIGDWSGKIAAIHCSTDAIIPTWAFMILSTKLQEAGIEHYYGTPEQAASGFLLKIISSLDPAAYQDRPVVIKGCSGIKISPEVYMAISNKLIGTAKSIMFGEPCSTVPVYKRKKP